MSNINTGGPAFPCPMSEQTHLNQDCAPFQGGMTLRDYFATKALSAIYATAMKEASEGSGLFQYDDWRIGLALDAYAMADAMLKARVQA